MPLILLKDQDKSPSAIAWGFLIGGPLGNSAVGAAWTNVDLPTFGKFLAFTSAEMALIQFIYFSLNGKVHVDVGLAAVNALAGMILLPTTTVLLVEDYRSRKATSQDSYQNMLHDRHLSVPYSDHYIGLNRIFRLNLLQMNF